MKRDPSGYWESIGVKGEGPGHPFRGNQYTQLYHGTTINNVGDILKQGLDPDASMGNYGEEYYEGERGKSVYGCRSVRSALEWAGANAITDPKKEYRVAVFRVAVPKGKLKPDEEGSKFDYRVRGRVPPKWIQGYEIYRHVPTGPRNQRWHLEESHNMGAKQEETICYVPRILAEEAT